ncbi:MAG: HlyD family efflux transporter periplasmic adaptor subunit [Chloroflexota bacterium]
MLAPAVAALMALSLLAGCNAKSDIASTPTTATVQRGNLTIDITTTGNLKLSVTAEPAFEISGYVAEVLVDEGQAVEKGQLLARLDTSTWEAQIRSLETALISAKRQITSKETAVLQAKVSLKNAEIALEDMKEQNTTTYVEPVQIELKEMQVELARLGLESAIVAVDDAKRSLVEAQEAYDEARAKSPEVKAPIAGFVVKVNVTGGAEVFKGAIPAKIADPTRFEAELSVNETDIADVSPGMAANVKVDALSVTLPAKVTKISPTATISSSVAIYKVEVELDQQSGSNETISKLREGMSVTVSIVLQERKDVLLVPNRAIIQQGNNIFVQIAGTNEMRTIKTGISDYQYTEVLEGLTEGEQVVVSQATSTTSSSSPSQFGGPPDGGIMGPPGDPGGVPPAGAPPA